MVRGNTYRCDFEGLEDRTLMSGVTVITHGYQLTNSADPWVHEMALAVAARAGPDTSIYRMKLSGTGSQVRVAGFQLVAGKPLTTPTHRNNEAVIELDWAEASGVVHYADTAAIAALVKPFLVNPIRGVGTALAQTPVHLIGHSRGGSMVSALARSLGASGIWVDQLTLLDAHPVRFDAPAQVTSNVYFADNYFQTNWYPTGATPTGALHVNLSNTVFGSHTAVHEYYDTTVRRLNRGGFDYGRIGGSTRPAQGVGYGFGGLGGRVSPGFVGPQWPNIGVVKISSPGTRRIGDAVGLKFLFQDRDSASNVQWFLDNDLNPYNGSKAALTKAQPLRATGDVVYQTTAQGTIKRTVPAGTYAVVGRVTDPSGHVRFAYGDKLITVRAG